MPYNKKINMSMDQAREEIRDIDQKLENQADQQDDAMQAVQGHIAKIDNENEQES
ncbi:hypothetical protein [Gorillibacterium sp. sgz5001074]|uniref:hypothetical protein n=1 Tax=Gorillibacterium sp. sgz5001074 TaxID=3446695 RepID=UPI003F660C93